MHKILIDLFSLSVITILNAVYFLKTVIRIYTPEKREVVVDKGFQDVAIWEQSSKSIAMICLIALNFFLGLCSEPVVELIERGLEMFA